ncbi:MAG: hypothetical protein AB7C90_08175 [Bacteroidales bacterium]
MDDQLLKILSSIAILLFTLFVGKKRKPESMPVPRQVLTDDEEEDSAIPRELWDTELPDESQRTLERGSASSAPYLFQEAASLETLTGLEASPSRFDLRNAPAERMFKPILPEEEEELPQLSFDGDSGFDLRQAVLYQTILERREL